VQTGRRAENPVHRALPVARDLGNAGAILFSDKSAIQFSRTTSDDRLHPTTAQRARRLRDDRAFLRALMAFNVSYR
jgi:hypothetical protein